MITDCRLYHRIIYVCFANFSYPRKKTSVVGKRFETITTVNEKVSPKTTATWVRLSKKGGEKHCPFLANAPFSESLI